MKQFNNVAMKLGFSLIEMLVVVSIIAIMAGIGLSVFTGSNKKAHDAKQKADIESIRSSLELYKADNSGYPIQGSITTALAAYLPQYPTPPAGGTYVYTTPGCSAPGPCPTYSICTTLELDGSGYCGIPGGIAITPAAPTPTPTSAVTPTSTPAPTSTPVPTATPTAGACQQLGGTCRLSCSIGEVSQGQQNCGKSLVCCVSEEI